MDIHPATKEQRDLLFQKMKEEGYEWDAEKKELKKIIDEERIKKNLQDNSFRRMFEQKLAWSEEDDEMLDSIIEEVRYIGDFPDYPTEEENELYDECLAKVKWLKSLKERYTWKPTEEQMIELRRVISGCSYDIEPLAEMAEQLKKLSE